MVREGRRGGGKEGLESRAGGEARLFSYCLQDRVVSPRPSGKGVRGFPCLMDPFAPVPSRAVSIGTRGNCRTISSCSCSKHFNAV